MFWPFRVIQGHRRSHKYVTTWVQYITPLLRYSITKWIRQQAKSATRSCDVIRNVDFAQQIFLHSKNYTRYYRPITVRQNPILLLLPFVVNKSLSKTSFSATYFRHHHRLTTSEEEDRIANYFLNTLGISWTPTSLLVCCIKIFTDDNQYTHFTDYNTTVGLQYRCICMSISVTFYIVVCCVQFTFWKTFQIDEYTTTKSKTIPT